MLSNVRKSTEPVKPIIYDAPWQSIVFTPLRGFYRPVAGARMMEPCLSTGFRSSGAIFFRITSSDPSRIVTLDPVLTALTTN